MQVKAIARHCFLCIKLVKKNNQENTISKVSAMTELSPSKSFMLKSSSPV